MIPDRPVVLVLEDDVELSAEIIETAEHFGWTVLHARHVEGALVCARVNGVVIKLAFIDMMVPLTNAMCERMDRADAERTDVAGQYVERVFEDLSADKVRKAQADLGAMDATKQQCISLTGGAHFLEQAAAHLSDAVIVVFSARTTDEELRVRVNRAVTGGKGVYWCQKPLDPDSLVSYLLPLR